MLHRINCFGQIGQRQTQDQNAEPAPNPSPPSSLVDYIIFHLRPILTRITGLVDPVIFTFPWARPVSRT